MNKQNRPAPAYQEYAAQIMSRWEYRALTLDQRGLLYSMRLECWVNRTLPESPDLLGRILGFDPREVAAALPFVMPFFACEDGKISCPELDSYRKHLENVRTRQSDAAKATNAQRWGGKTRANAGNQGIVAKRVGKRSVGDRSSDRSLVQYSPVQPSQEGGEVTTTYVDGWSDFTADPDDDGGEV